MAPAFEVWQSPGGKRWEGNDQEEGILGPEWISRKGRRWPGPCGTFQPLPSRRSIIRAKEEGREMDGFALVALRQGRRKGEVRIPDGMLKKIEEGLRNPEPHKPGEKPKPDGFTLSGEKPVRPITRYHGSETVPSFNVRIDIQADNLTPAFEWIDQELHRMGFSHSEGYG